MEMYGQTGGGGAVVPRVEAVHALASASGNYAEELLEHWNPLSAVLADALEGEQPCALRLHAARCLQTLSDWDSLLPSSWWWEVIRVHLRAGAEDEFHSVRAAAISTLGQIPQKSIGLIEVETLSSLVIRAMSDKEASVRMSAATTVGTLIGASPLRTKRAKRRHDDSPEVNRCELWEMVR